MEIFLAIFIAITYSILTGGKVEAAVIRSVLRGDKTCVYEIRFHIV